VTDIEQIMKYDVMGMPALVVDEKVLFSGKGMDVGDIITLFSKEDQSDHTSV
jgi:predicted DsbA family dithiol-disulfide isomerase